MKRFPIIAAFAAFAPFSSTVLAGGLTPPVERPILSPPVMSGPVNSDWYGSAFVGTSSLSDFTTRPNGAEIDLGFAFANGTHSGFTFGRRFGDHWRLEAEVSRSTYGLETVTLDGGDVGRVSGGIDATFLLANLWYDVPTESRFSPYAGGGVGVANVDPSFVFDSPSPPENGETAFAYQIGLGAIAPLTDHLSLDIGYRYRSVPDFEMSRPRSGGPISYESVSVNSHSLQVGLQFTF